MNSPLIERVITRHTARFGAPPRSVAYGPGRIEVLGNHTDYNEGFVISAAIDEGVCAAVSGGEQKHCVLAALDPGETAEFDLPVEKPLKSPHWANYIAGVVNQLGGEGKIEKGFNLIFSGNLPAGAGLSSSAALEVAAALALIDFYGLQPPQMRIAELCQQAENEFTGARCGLLDQISSLFGAERSLIFTDFRTLAVETVPVDKNICFLMVNTGVKHSLAASAYNERRAACERAALFFASVLDHPVKALRDVSPEELKKHCKSLDPVVARRAAHIVGENARVVQARRFLQAGDMKKFGKLMFASHESSRINFENSCKELDFIVEIASGLKEVLGARLSGGGFGGSAVLLVRPEDAAGAGVKISSAYAEKFGNVCAVSLARPSAGARLIGRQGKASC
ncbi:MAG: galactokinase [Kiritimatiellae bacterium]|nr:galactokinase [Kiritimatiellia bacterium]